MVYERYPRDGNQGGDYTRDFGAGRNFSYSSARDYEAAGEYDKQGQNRGQQGYGQQNWNQQSRGQQDQQRAQNYGPQEYGFDGYSRRDHGQSGEYGQPRFDQGGQQGRDQGDYGQQNWGQQNWGQQGRGQQDRGQRDYGRADMYGQQQARGQARGQQDYGRQPQGYDYQERGFFDRAGDEVRSWFGDDEANRRREQDARADGRQSGQQQGGRSQHDDAYHSWRQGQIDALDRDYHEYRQENHSKFANEFGSWRAEREGQRGSLSKVNEHMEVLGSDGQHVGTVDKVRGDRIILTKNDQDAGGRHHSIPSRWIKSVDDKVTVSKTAEEAHAHWRDEERNGAFFNEDGSHKSEAQSGQDQGKGNQATGDRQLNKSFPGTY